jgi:hypothetical protein
MMHKSKIRMILGLKERNLHLDPLKRLVELGYEQRR